MRIEDSIRAQAVGAHTPTIEESLRRGRNAAQEAEAVLQGIIDSLNGVGQERSECDPCVSGTVYQAQSLADRAESILSLAQCVRMIVFDETRPMLAGSSKGLG